MGEEKLQFHEKEAKRWRDFIESIRNNDIISLGDNTSNIEMVAPPSVSEPPPPEPEPKKKEAVPMADILREYFNTQKRKASGMVISKWIIKKLHTPKADQNKVKEKVYMQLRTFVREGYCEDSNKRIKGKNGKLITAKYYEYVGESN